MTSLLVDINALRQKALHELEGASSASGLEAWRVQYLGRKGEVPQLLRTMKDLPVEERKKLGQEANTLRNELENLYLAKSNSVTEDSTSASSQVVSSVEGGHLHPLTLALRRAQQIFAAMGFTIVEGPTIELAKYNFDGLNIDAEHPARAETDTFYLKDLPELVLRTHVSPLQIRGVLENKLKPPFKMFYYGPSFRSEKEDATHTSLFQQYEFMVVDETVNLANLKHIITTFYSLFFERAVEVRFRPSFFPFVKPGLEVHMRDQITHKGGWLEMAGAGNVHPNVLKNINVDPDKYQGIALGGGLDRLVMLKYGIPDIRLLYSGDLKFLKQFS
ncbi:MAG: phenylalanine--tRNA ligase subunit alpha [Candidatus Andersenbacteria bacterium]|nr:phenylalanine--tRNA ligase subunit alpha [Candidatus Andersenbacteria bacterium]